jgi:competence ComEA-like helix-hairpin-helix protein
MRWFQISMFALAAGGFLVLTAPAFAAEEYEERGAVLMEWAAPELVNLNTAGIDQLAGIPGIGTELGLAIIWYRDENGPFSKLEDLLKVKGVGQEQLDTFRYWVILE